MRGPDINKIQPINWKRKHAMTRGSDTLILWNAPQIPPSKLGVFLLQNPQVNSRQMLKFFLRYKEAQPSVCPNKDMYLQSTESEEGACW